MLGGGVRVVTGTVESYWIDDKMGGGYGEGASHREEEEDI